MHMGITEGPDCARPFATLHTGARDGAVSRDGRVAGTYVHGLFSDDAQRGALMDLLQAGPPQTAYELQVDETLDRLAAHLSAHVDIDRLLSLAG